MYVEDFFFDYNLIVFNKFQCHDKCQCCTNKMEIYQRKLETFLVNKKTSVFDEEIIAGFF